MSVRQLTTLNTANLKGSKEFNHLRVLNLDEFLSTYDNNYDYYSPPFKILAELEEKIMYENNPPETVLCAYKPDGDIIFYLAGIKEERNKRIVEYTYATSVS